jgi:hypothetical protein
MGLEAYQGLVWAPVNSRVFDWTSLDIRLGLSESCK